MKGGTKLHCEECKPKLLKILYTDTDFHFENNENGGLFYASGREVILHFLWRYKPQNTT